MFKLGDRDSNPGLLIQSQLSYRWTIPQRKAIIAHSPPLSSWATTRRSPSGGYSIIGKSVYLSNPYGHGHSLSFIKTFWG